MDSLQRQKLRRRLAVILCALAVVGLFAWHALAPGDPKADTIQDVTDTITARNWDEASPAEREALRRQIEALPVETRREIVTEVARHRIAELRTRFEDLGDEERRAEINEMRQRLRRHRQQMDDAERQRIRERLASPEGAQMLRHAMEIYSQEFTARERAELDPLMHEWFAQLQDIMRE